MAKKRLWYLLVFLAIVPIALASPEEQIYSGTVESGQVIEADDYRFGIKVAGTVGASVNYSSRSFLVKAGECEWDGNLKFCIGTPAFSYRNSETWEDIYKVSVDITLKQGFDINKSIENTRLLIGEKTDVKVLILNDGAFPIENVDFKDAYPPQLKVTNADGCFLVNNAIEWHGVVGKNSRQVCTYTLAAVDGIEYVSQAEASYYDGREKQKAYSKKIKVRVQNYSLKVTPSVNITKQGIGGLIDVGLLLENIYPDELNVKSFEITVPVGLSIAKNSNELEKKGQLMHWEGRIERDGKKEFMFSLNAEKAGNFTIEMKEKYAEGGIERSFVKFLNGTVDCDCLLIQHKLLMKDEDTAHLRVYIYNPSYENRFSDISVDLSTTIPHADEIKTMYNVLNPRETILLFNDEVDIPRGGLYYDIGIEYESDYRQRFKDSKSIAIEQVRPEISEESTKEDFMEESTAITEITDGTALSASVNESEEAVAPAGETLDQDEKIGLLVMGIIFFVVVGILVQVIYRKNS